MVFAVSGMYLKNHRKEAGGLSPYIRRPCQVDQETS